MTKQNQQSEQSNEESDSWISNLFNDGKLRRRELMKSAALMSATSSGAAGGISVVTQPASGQTTDDSYENPNRLMIRQGYNNGGQLESLTLGNATFKVKWEDLMVGDIIDLDLQLRRLQVQTRHLPDSLFDESNSFYESGFTPTDPNRLLVVYHDIENEMDKFDDETKFRNNLDTSQSSEISDIPSSEININKIDTPTNWETLGQTSVQVDQQTRGDSNPLKVDGSSFYNNRTNVDIANHSQVTADELDVDLDLTDSERELSNEKRNDWKRGVLYQLRIKVTAPDESTFISQQWFLHTTIKAQLGFGIQFGTAYAVKEEHQTESDPTQDTPKEYFTTTNANFGEQTIDP